MSASAHTNKLTSCVNTDPKNCCTLESCTLSAGCETSEFASFNVFCSVRVYIRRTWPPACPGLMLISCHCPSSLNITLEFHLKGRIDCECENFLCLMNKTGGKSHLIVALMLFFVPLPSVHIVHNIKHDLILPSFP